MNTRISEEDWVHISLASLHNAVIYWLGQAFDES